MEQYYQTVQLEEEQKKRPVMSHIPLTDKEFIYRNSSQTNVQSTWKRFGWQPTEKHYERQS